MATIAPERAEQIVASWLEGTDPVEGLEHPAGPLFAEGYSEHEITMSNPKDPGWTANCCLCSGSFDPQWGWIQCC